MCSTRVRDAALRGVCRALSDDVAPTHTAVTALTVDKLVPTLLQRCDIVQHQPSPTLYQRHAVAPVDAEPVLVARRTFGALTVLAAADDRTLFSTVVAGVVDIARRCIVDAKSDDNDEQTESIHSPLLELSLVRRIYIS